MFLGVLEIVFGAVFINFGSVLTKKYIIKNNPEAAYYSSTGIKREWQNVAGKNIVPIWVSIVGLLGWGAILYGVFTIVKSFV